MRGKRKTYTATSPYKIKELHDQKKENMDQNIDSLILNFAHQDKKPHIIYQEGKKALMYVFSDIVHSL